MDEIRGVTVGVTSSEGALTAFPPLPFPHVRRPVALDHYADDRHTWLYWVDELTRGNDVSRGVYRALVNATSIEKVVDAHKGQQNVWTTCSAYSTRWYRVYAL